MCPCLLDRPDHGKGLDICDVTDVCNRLAAVGPATSVTDQADNTQISCPDSLGRLKSATEPAVPDANSILATPTSNLRVRPPEQPHQRHFAHSNPAPFNTPGPIDLRFQPGERGGFLCVKSTALQRRGPVFLTTPTATRPSTPTRVGTMTTMTYDGLDRIKSRTYAGGTAAWWRAARFRSYRRPPCPFGKGA